MKKLNLKHVVVFLSVTFISSFGWANLLIDPGFEANPLNNYVTVLGNYATYQGQWGDELSTITGVDGGVTPAQLTKMLRMDFSGGVATQTFQVTDVSSYAALIDAGNAVANLNALFNANPALSGAVGNVTALFFDVSATWGSPIGATLATSTTLDNAPSTWQVVGASGAVPVNTRWIVSQVAYINSSLLAADGAYYPGYVDAADLTITQIPEPATLGLLALGSLVMRSKRKSVLPRKG